MIINNIITRNNTSGTETKYINIKFYYVRDFYNNQIMVLQFVKSGDNKNNIITKNSTQKIEKHVSKLMRLVPEKLLVSIKKQKGY